MKYRLLVLSIITLHFLISNAKTIEGRVLDRDSIPVEFANIVGFANDSVVNVSVSDESGHFRFYAAENCNRISISCIGYEDTIISKIKPDLGVIIINRNSTTLQEVVVRAPLIIREPDRFILNISANPLSANKDAQELLKTAPGVWATDESLSIYGQGGTIVYIGDRKVNMNGNQLMSYLKSIQSSSIATIEIIPKAGAEYNADSSGGVIRINLKHNVFDGLNGSTGLNVTAGEYKQWVSPFVNISLHSGKCTFNFNGNVNGSPSDKYTSNEESQILMRNLEMAGVSYHKKKTIQGNISLGLFYDISNKDKIGLQFDYNPEKTDQISNALTEMTNNDFIGETFGNYKIKDIFHNFNVSFNWSHFIDDKGSDFKLISNYNYQNSSVKEDDVMSWTYLENDSIFKTDNLNCYKIFVTELSLRKVFNPSWNLNIGGKYTLNNVLNRSNHTFLRNEFWINNGKYDFDTSYEENIIALYAIANGKIGRWKFKAGIRGEYSGTKGDYSNYDRIDLFPNANLSYNLTEKGDYTIALGYYRNIRRPSFQSLNPTAKQVSDYTYTVGNPKLIPSFTDAVSLDFVLASKFTIATGYSITDNPIRQMFISNPDFPERLYFTWDNEGNDKTAFIHADGLINITKWWNLYSSLTYVITSQKMSDDDAFDTFSYLQLVASATFLLPKGFNLTLNCLYNSKMKVGNITVFPMLNLNPILQKRFGKNWSILIGLDNLLQRKNKIRAESNGYSRLTYSKSYINIKLGVTFTFNSGEKFRSQRIEKNTDNSRFTKE